jgi:hypothetical protein
VFRPHERSPGGVGDRMELVLPVARLHAFGADDERRIEGPG